MGKFVETPVGKRPICLRLQIVIFVLPRDIGEITLDKATDAIVEANSRIRANQRMSLFVMGTKVMM
jgi:hypothetical protein